MKLYTENQVKDLLLSTYIITERDINMILKKTKPIEIPSDEDIEKYLKSFPYTKHLDDGQYNDGVIVGADLAIQWIMGKLN